MKTRITTALVMLAIFIPILFIGGIPLRILISLLALIGIYEFFTMKKMNYFSLEGAITSIATLSIVNATFPLAYFSSNSSFFYIFFTCILFLMLCTVYRPEVFSFEEVSFFTLAALYVGGGFSGILFVRDIGFSLVFLIFMIIWSTDSFAYLFGRFFGKRKLAPKISPNKTIEGTIGGVFGAVVIGLIYLHFFNTLSFNLLESIFLIIVISVAGQLGDLVESAYKRSFQVKDSGTIFPGHGGVLDRFDSTFFAMYMFQIYLAILINFS